MLHVLVAKLLFGATRIAPKKKRHPQRELTFAPRVFGARKKPLGWKTYTVWSPRGERGRQANTGIFPVFSDEMRGVLEPQNPQSQRVVVVCLGRGSWWIGWSGLGPSLASQNQSTFYTAKLGCWKSVQGRCPIHLKDSLRYCLFRVGLITGEQWQKLAKMSTVKHQTLPGLVWECHLFWGGKIMDCFFFVMADQKLAKLG